MSTKEGEVQCGAIWALGEIGTPQVVDQLVAEMYIKNANNGLRDEAIMALTKIGSKHRVPQIIQALHDYDPYVRAGAAEVLGLTRNTTALPAPEADDVRYRTHCRVGSIKRCGEDERYYAIVGFS